MEGNPKVRAVEALKLGAEAYLKVDSLLLRRDRALPFFVILVGAGITYTYLRPHAHSADADMSLIHIQPIPI